MAQRMQARKATYRVLHSLRRKAAGEHIVNTDTIILAFVEEWELTAIEATALVAKARRLEADMAKRQT